MTLGLDIGNKNAFMSVCHETRGMIDLVNENTMIGLPTDAIVQPNGPALVNKGLSYSGKPPALDGRAILHAVKNMLGSDSIECETGRGDVFTVNTADVYAAIVQEMITVAAGQSQTEGLKPVYDAVIALPAQFYDGPGSGAVQDKIKKAVGSIRVNGKPVVLRDTIPEPAAAAIDYLFYCRNELPEEKRISQNRYTVIVYDLGHGTFDTALVEVDAEEGIRYRLHHQLGFSFGGKDMDQRILDLFVEQAAGVLKDGDALQRLRRSERYLQKAQEAKEHLSEMQEYEFDDVFPAPITYRITRAEFESMIDYEIDQTLRQLQILFDHAAQIRLPVDMIVLSGGCSYIPFVRQKVNAFAQAHGVPCCVSTRPGKAVSYGAARYAAARELLTRYTGYNYCILTDLNGKALLPAIPIRSQLPYESRVTVPRGGDCCWIVRSLDANDPADENSLEPFKRIFRFQPKSGTDGQALTVRVRMGEDYRLQVSFEQ